MARTPAALRAALALTILASSMSTPSGGEAQILRKLKDAAATKAADKLGDKAVEKAGLESVGSERPGERELLGAPLTADTLDLLLNGLRVMGAQMTERDRLQQQIYAWQNLSGELRGSATIQHWRERERLVSECQSDIIQDREKAAQEEVQRAVQRDPARYNASALKFAQDIAPLQAKGDMEGIQRAQLKWMRELTGIDPKQDSIAARAKCGSIPPKPREMAQIDSLDGLVKKGNVEMRALEATAAEKGAAAAGGMPGLRFAQARERLLTWFYDGAKERHRFPEARLLASRRTDIDRVRSAF